MKKVFFLFPLLVFILSCGEELSPLGLTSASIVNLADDAGGIPAQVVFRGDPSSVTDKSSKETVGVPFHIEIDLNKSPTRAMVIANGLTSGQITMEVIFIDTKKQSYPFTISPFVKMAPQPGLVPTYAKTTNEVWNLPFAVEKVARIDFTVDKTVVATTK